MSLTIWQRAEWLFEKLTRKARGMKFSDLEPADRPEIVDLYISVSRARLFDDESGIVVLDAEAWEGEPIAGGGKTKRRLIGFYCEGLAINGQHLTSMTQQLENSPHPLDQSVFVRVRAERQHVFVKVRDGKDLIDNVALDNIEWLDEKGLELDHEC